jgi:hypothetical protein
MKFLRKVGNEIGQLFIVFNSTYDLVSREVLCNILTATQTPIKLVKLKEVCLNITYRRSVQAYQEGLKLNGTLPFLIYVNGDNLLHENIYTIKKTTDALLVANKEVGLE